MIRSLKFRLVLVLSVTAVAACGADLGAVPRINQPAPAFSVVDTSGQVRSLEEFRGQPVVLEWTARNCSYVTKHYDSGNIPMQQRKARKDFDAVWLTVISGQLSPQAADEIFGQNDAFPTAVLLDESGDMARAYDASVTPHLYIIDEAGILRYMGGIDSRPGEDLADVEGASQYVLLGLDRLAAGHPVVEPITRPYGCSISSP